MLCYWVCIELLDSSVYSYLNSCLKESSLLIAKFPWAQVRVPHLVQRDYSLIFYSVQHVTDIMLQSLCANSQLFYAFQQKLW